MAESRPVDARQRDDLPPLNWGLLGLVGLSIEFWVILGALVSPHIS